MTSGGRADLISKLARHALLGIGLTLLASAAQAVNSIRIIPRIPATVEWKFVSSVPPTIK